MAVMAVAQAVEDDLGDRHLAVLALAAGLVIHDLGEAAMLGQKLQHREIGRGDGAHGLRGHGCRDRRGGLHDGGPQDGLSAVTARDFDPYADD